MEQERYIAVSERVIPEVFSKVLEVKEIIYSGKAKDVSEATKNVGISRSTYYKYKDYVYPLTENLTSKKITIVLLLSHEAGSLSRVLDYLAMNNANIITINQDVPMNMAANVTITLDVSPIKGDVKKVLQGITEMESVLKLRILAVE